jgi:hypothetical protein
LDLGATYGDRESAATSALFYASEPAHHP